MEGLLPDIRVSNLLWLKCFEGLEENLSFSKYELRLRNIPEDDKFVRNPQALASFLYGGRLGNKTDEDAYKYRGRGYIKIRGRDNYKLLEEQYNLPFLEDPDLLCDMSIAWRVALDVCTPWLEKGSLLKYYEDHLFQLGWRIEEVTKDV